MQTDQPSLIARPDTLLGVCEAIGEDLGFNPTWLRVGFACMVFVNFALAIGAYLGLGVIVAAIRWFHPAPRKPMPQQARPVETQAPAEAGNDLEPALLAA